MIVGGCGSERLNTDVTAGLSACDRTRQAELHTCRFTPQDEEQGLIWRFICAGGACVWVCVRQRMQSGLCHEAFSSLCEGVCFPTH